MTQSARFELELSAPEYPQQLMALESPPRRLYGIGDPALLVPGLAIVGARRATPYGLRAAKLFATNAAQEGVSVISGAAIGCDQAAQRAALAAGGRSVAVMGCGADVDYPRNAGSLLACLRKEHLVLSENPWGTPPKPYLFAKRNVVIAALSAAVLVVEAAHKSGTMGTALTASRIGRPILAVPGSIFAPESSGTNRLLADGAVPIADVPDLMTALGIHFTPREPSGRSARSVDSPTQALLNACLADPMRPDDLSRVFDRDITWVLTTLGDLEIEGELARYPDGRYGPADTMRW